MRYSIEPKDRIYAKGYGILSFTDKNGYKLQAINMARNFLIVLKNQQQMQ